MKYGRPSPRYAPTGDDLRRVLNETVYEARSREEKINWHLARRRPASAWHRVHPSTPEGLDPHLDCAARLGWAP